MLDRGLRRGFDEAVEREARQAADRAGASQLAPRSARACDLHDRPVRAPATSTTRSPPSDSTARPCGSGCTSPTWPRTCARARLSTARRVGARRASTCREPSSRCCRRPSPTTPARSMPGLEPPGGDRRARAARGIRRPSRLLPIADPLRRSPRLRARRPDLRRPRARGRAMADCRSQPRARPPPRCRTRASGAERWSWTPRSPSSSSTATATSARSTVVCRPSPIA